MDRFEDDGYLVLDQVIKPRQLRMLLRELRDIAQKALSGQAMSKSTVVPDAARCTYELEKFSSGKVRQPHRLHKAQGVGLISSGVRNLISAPELAPSALSLVRRVDTAEELDAFGTKFFPVHPASAGSVGWHDDNCAIRLP